MLTVKGHGIILKSTAALPPEQLQDLETDIDELPVHELVWVVCANVSTEDLAWALINSKEFLYRH